MISNTRGSSNTKILLVILIAALAFAAYTKLSNPYRKYSTEEYWVSATVEDVYALPSEALAPGNKNGSVLMWAAMGSDKPEVITTLISRGANPNEADIIFSGTPLSGAAGYSKTPSVIDALIAGGADIGKVVGTRNKTPLIIASEINPNPEIIERLIFHGASLQYKDLTGRNALEQAKRFKNVAVIPILKKHMQIEAGKTQ